MDETPFLPPRYRQLRLLGAGGTGRVVLAEDVELSRPVAIKLLAPLDKSEEDDWAARLVEEARVLSRLRHDAIVSLYDLGHLDTGRPFLVFEFVEGSDLAKLLDSEKRLELERTCELVLPVLSGLAHAHELGIVHRDVKPANILIRASSGRSVLADFGCARSESRRIKTQTGIVLGTPGYVAPEVLAGEQAVPASDLYAVGCVLHEALVGRAPFAADSVPELLMAHLRRELPPTGLAAPLDKLVRQVLAKEPGERHADARALARDLDLVRRTLVDEARAERAERGGELGPGSRGVSRSRGRTTDRTRPLGPVDNGDTRVMPSSARRRPRPDLRALVAMLVVVFAIGAGFGVWLGSHGPGSVRPALTLDASGTLTASWVTTRPLRCRLVVAGPAGTGEQVEPGTAAEHEMTLAGLVPGAQYEAQIDELGGDRLWSGRVRLPSPEELVVDAPGEGRTRVRVTPLGVEVVACALERVSAAATQPSTMTPTGAEFELAGARTLIEEGATVRLLARGGQKLRWPVISGRAEVAALARALDATALHPMIEELVRPPLFSKLLGVPQWPRVPGLPTPLEPWNKRVEQRRRLTGQPDGAFPAQVRRRFAHLPAGARLLALAPTLPAYFASLSVPPSEKLAAFRMLCAVEWLDHLCASQFEQPALGVAAWYRPLVAYEHVLPVSGDKPDGWMELLERGRAFLTQDTAMFETGLTALGTDPGWGSWFLGSTDAAPAAFRALLTPPLELNPLAYDAASRSAGLDRRSGTVELRARVAMLAPTHQLEVSFVSQGKGELTIPLAQEGTRNWLQAMDDLLPDGRYVGMLEAREAPPGHAIWGEVCARFPADLLPEGPFRVRVEYRHVPGVPVERLVHLDRFVALASLRMSIR